MLAAFNKLDTVLTDTQSLWRPQPFTQGELAWRHSHPQLSDALLALDDTQAQRLHDDPRQRVAWFQALQPELCAALYRFEPPEAATSTTLALDRFDHVAIPGRKWQQITAFAAALPQSGLPLVDWCAGKGHLSRIVQRSQQQPVHCLEWDGDLVEAGIALAQKQQLDIHYHQHDVKQAAPSCCTRADSVHIALHACGELHIRLLQHVTDSQAHAVALSPCCYHKISADHYQPLSGPAQQSALSLDRPALHLAVQDTVTAGRSERQLREQQRLWRLGFDALQRELRNSDSYLPVPSSPRSLLRQDFPAFCQWAASTRQLQLPDTLDYDHYLQQGRDRHHQVFRLELLRRLFNRPLELWLVLDRALYLEQHGYRVSISRFCDSAVTPRNLILLAERR